MQIKQTGCRKNPTILLLHGGGLSWWSLQDSIDALKDEYHVVTPILDGHGEDGESTFESIEECAKKLIGYIDAEHNGSVFALCGLSIGAQIAAEVLSLRVDIAQYAVLESAMVIPMKSVHFLAAPMCNSSYSLIKRRWFARLQAKSLCLPDDMVERYYADSLRISKQSLLNMMLSNSSYRLKKGLSNTHANVLVIVGERELGAMKRSAQALHMAIAQSKLYVAPAMKHGELSLKHPTKYTAILRTFFQGGFGGCEKAHSTTCNQI